MIPRAVREEAVERLLCAADLVTIGEVHEAVSLLFTPERETNRAIRIAADAWDFVYCHRVGLRMREGWTAAHWRLCALEAAGLLLDGWSP